jgi:hypothetical protein
VLFKLTSDPATPPSVRARTGQYLLERADKSLAREQEEDGEGRLTAMERVMGVDADEKRKFPKAA